MTQPLGLPASVLDLGEFSPVEDVVLAILRERLPDVRSGATIPDSAKALDTWLLVRRVPTFGAWGGDERFFDRARFSINSFTSDPDGDEKGAALSEAVRVIMRQASRVRKRYDGLGAVSRIRMVQEPIRRPDWATATGPVQYADLPTGFWRYESQYVITVRKR